MVQVTVRYAESEDTFLIALPGASLVSLLIHNIVELHNLRQRIRALCDIMKAHTPTRDADLVAKMLSEATACLSKEQVSANVEATPQLYTATINSMRDLIGALFAPDVAAEAARIVSGETPAAGERSEGSVAVWWAKKELAPGEALSAYVGRHERTKITVTLAARSASALGAPAAVRAPAADPHREAYLNAKATAALSPPPADEDDDTRNAPWAQPTLRSVIRGTANLGYRVEEY